MSLFLSNELIVFLFLEILLFLFAIYSFFGAISILRKWDFNSTKEIQFKLEKKSYLISTALFFILTIKITLFPFFAHLIESLAILIPGAMCGAGVINANEYGSLLLTIKIFLIYFFGVWLIVNKEDILAKNYPFTKRKYSIFIALFIFLLIEFLIELLYFSNISTKNPVMCCSVIFGAIEVNPLPFGLDTKSLLILFFLTYLLIVISALQKQLVIFSLANLFFLPISYYSLVYFFGTYIYELPTHKCPFCMLQFEYHFIGYFLWGSLLIGSFFGISNLLLKAIIEKEKISFYKLSLIFTTIFALLCLFYPISYYLKSGVWL